MTLWTIQPRAVYDLILDRGVYRCDPALCSLPELLEYYDWLVEQMKKRIGPPQIPY